METKPPLHGNFLFTSESVCDGHPDKIADQVSDAIVDACLQQDSSSRIACETVTKTGMIMVFGDITTKARVDYDVLVRDTIKSIGYVSPEHGLDYRTLEVVVKLDVQPPESGPESGQTPPCNEQCVVSGYASNETPELMPLSHSLACGLCARLGELRRSGACPWLRPDGKAQVTLELRKSADGSLTPVRVHTVVISVQHSPDVAISSIREEVLTQAVRHVVPARLLDDSTILHVNPSGRFVIGGPRGDAGLTGRQLATDSYGGWGSHSTGPLSGRDGAHHLDRAAAYACRWVAKTLVASGLAARCLVQAAYAPGEPRPISLHVDSYGSAKPGVSDEALGDIARTFDLRLSALASDLRLEDAQYSRLATHGHFGRQAPIPEWEKAKDISSELVKIGA